MLVQIEIRTKSSKRSCGDPGENLSCTDLSEKILWRSWWSPFQVVLAWSCAGPCEKILWRSWWRPLSGPCWSSADPYQKMLWGFWWILGGPCMILHGSLWEGLKILLKPSLLLVRRLSGDPGDFFCTCPCEKILFKSSLRGPRIEIWQMSAFDVLVWNFFWDAYRKFWYEWRFCKRSIWLTILWSFLQCPGVRFCYEVLRIELFDFLPFLPVYFVSFWQAWTPFSWPLHKLRTAVSVVFVITLMLHAHCCVQSSVHP